MIHDSGGSTANRMIKFKKSGWRIISRQQYLRVKVHLYQFQLVSGLPDKERLLEVGLSYVFNLLHPLSVHLVFKPTQERNWFAGNNWCIHLHESSLLIHLQCVVLAKTKWNRILKMIHCTLVFNIKHTFQGVPSFHHTCWLPSLLLHFRLYYK